MLTALIVNFKAAGAIVFKKIKIMIGLFGAVSYFAASGFDSSKCAVFYSARKNKIMACYTHVLPGGILEVIHVSKPVGGKTEEHSHVSLPTDARDKFLLNEEILREIRYRVNELEKRILLKVTPK